MKIVLAILTVLLIYITIKSVFFDYKVLYNLNSYKLSEIKIDSVRQVGSDINFGFFVYSKELLGKRIKLSNLRNRDEPIEVWSSNCCMKAFISNEKKQFPTLKVIKFVVFDTFIIIILSVFLILLIRSIRSVEDFED